MTGDTLEVLLYSMLAIVLFIFNREAQWIANEIRAILDSVHRRVLTAVTKTASKDPPSHLPRKASIPPENENRYENAVESIIFGVSSPTVSFEEETQSSAATFALESSSDSDKTKGQLTTEELDLQHNGSDTSIVRHILDEDDDTTLDGSNSESLICDRTTSHVLADVVVQTLASVNHVQKQPLSSDDDLLLGIKAFCDTTKASDEKNESLGSIDFSHVLQPRLERSLNQLSEGSIDSSTARKVANQVRSKIRRHRSFEFDRRRTSALDEKPQQCRAPHSPSRKVEKHRSLHELVGFSGSHGLSCRIDEEQELQPPVNQCKDSAPRKPDRRSRRGENSHISGGTTLWHRNAVPSVRPSSGSTRHRIPGDRRSLLGRSPSIRREETHTNSAYPLCQEESKRPDLRRLNSIQRFSATDRQILHRMQSSRNIVS